MALCKELCDDVSAGITFKCVKDCYNMLDIVELEKSSNDDDPDDEENIFNPSGYEELAQALRSVIWSNVDMNHGKNSLPNPSAIKSLLSLLSNLIKFLVMENLKTDLQSMTRTRRTKSSMSRANLRTLRSSSARWCNSVPPPAACRAKTGSTAHRTSQKSSRSSYYRTKTQAT